MLSSILEPGATVGSLPANLRSRLRITNVVALCTLGACIPFLIAHAATGGWLRAGVLLAEIPLMLGVLVLNRWGRHMAARWLMLSVMTLVVLFMAASADASSRLWVVLLALAGLATVPFSAEERLHALFFVGLSVTGAVLGLTGVLGQLAPILGEPQFPIVPEYVLVVSSMVLAPLLVLFHVASADQREQDLARSEADLRQASARLEKAVELLAERSAEATAASEAKSRFLAHMSHEIRTPLAGVIGLLDLARDSDDPTTQQDHLDLASASADHMLHVLNDILDLSRVEQGSMPLESIPFDLGALVEEVGAMARVQASAKGLAVQVRCELDGAPWRLGDPLRIRQVLLNLVHNAVKFTAEGGIELHATCEHDQVLLCVSDSGIGMSAEQLSRVFDAYGQAEHSTTRRYGGTGLGLAISRRIAEQAGGSLTATSEPDVGTTFELRLPLPPTDPASPSRARASTGAAVASLDVLLVEDHPINQRIARHVLQDLGHQVTLCEDGEQAVAAARDAFDVILMDLRMPRLDGLEATAAIRVEERERGRPRVPIVALSANAGPEDIRACEEAGMDAHIAKPIDRGVLQRTLARVLRASHVEA